MLSPDIVSVASPLPGASKMHARVRAHDWAQTSLGPIERWPQSLRTVVGTCLDSALAQCVWWGPDLIQIHNDLAIDTAGARAACLGRPARMCWPEIWPDLGKIAQLVLATGEPKRYDGFALARDHGARRHTAFFDLWCSALRDESGAVAGVLVSAVETSGQMHAEAASAVEPASAEQALRTSKAWLAGQKEALQAAVNDAPLEASLAVLIRTACELDKELRCAIYLANEESTGLRLAVGMNEDYARLVDGFKIGPDSFSCGLAVHLDQPITTADVTREPLWEAWLPMARAHDFRACWSFPIQTTAGKAVGTFAMYYREPREATARDHETAAIVTRAAAIIIARHQASERRQRTEAALRESEARLDQANRAKDEFLAMLGHELRNPLQPIVTTLELMRIRQPDALTQERAIIQSQVQHIHAMVDDLLDVSRIARGKLELHKTQEDLAEVILQAIDATRPAFEENRQKIDTTLAQSLLVSGDRRRLIQIVTNLLTNAAKYSPPETTIEVSAGIEDGDAVLRVCDAGIGIDAALLTRIFEAFAQDPQSIERSRGGLGLGLAIVHNLVTLHGGSVQAHSGGRDCGSEFVVRLPLLQHAQCASPESAKTAQPASSHAQDARQLKVLIVDDYAPVADSLAELLHVQGYDIRVARDGAEALSAAGEFKPDLALIDIGLPVMDGYEVARRLRADPNLEHVSLVAATGYGQESDRKRVAAAGFDAHLVKPVNAAGLRDILAQVAAGARPAGS